MRFYQGNITPEENTIFVFGSNPVNDLIIQETRSISEANIIRNITDLYNLARSVPEKDFKVACKTKVNEKSPNGYTGREMLSMFTINPIPNNIYFPEEWHEIFCHIHNYDGYYVNHSGGAVGSDSMWGELGAQYGIVSEHYWHGNRTKNGNHEITEDEFEEGKDHVLLANKTLHRKPYRYMNLLARNYMQVKYSDEIFGIGCFKNKVVDGGTGWAVQMAIDDGKTVNFYDQERNVWGRYSNGKWEQIDTPILTKNFAGIGTRELNENGMMAIKDVIIKTFEH